MKIPLGRTLGAYKLAKIVPRGSWTAPRECPDVPRRAQRGKKEAQETPKRALRTPTWPHLDAFGAQMGRCLVKIRWTWRSKLRNIEKWKSFTNGWKIERQFLGYLENADGPPFILSYFPPVSTKLGPTKMAPILTKTCDFEKFGYLKFTESLNHEKILKNKNLLLMGEILSTNF